MPQNRRIRMPSVGDVVQSIKGRDRYRVFLVVDMDESDKVSPVVIADGRLHKLDHVTFEIPMKDGKEDYLSPWRFTSSDGRFEMQFQPVLDRAACTDFKLLKSDQHQVFGTFTGTAVLDDGSALSVRDFFGFAEKVENKW